MTIEQQPGGANELNWQPAVASSKFVEVSAALIFRDGKLLITQRHARSHLGGLWEFPGGKREAGETFEQCLVREIREELGVDIVVGELFEEVAHAYPEKSVRLKFFTCQLLSGEPQPLDCAAVKWVTNLELASFQFPAADAQLLEKLKSPRKARA
jgi:mutator protein MutT